ncbi:MAG: hypothetical protein QXU92_01255 [Candidatus Diapherotrites archaeon]
MPYKIAFGITTIWHEFLDKATIENNSKFQNFGKYKIFAKPWILILNLDGNIIKIRPKGSSAEDKGKYVVLFGKSQDKSSNSNDMKMIGKIIKESIFMNDDFQQDNILILSGKPILNGKPLVFDYSLVSNCIQPIANYFTSVKNRNLTRILDILMPLTKNDIILVFAFFYINFVAIPRKSILKLQKT